MHKHPRLTVPLSTKYLPPPGSRGWAVGSSLPPQSTPVCHLRLRHQLIRVGHPHTQCHLVCRHDGRGRDFIYSHRLDFVNVYLCKILILIYWCLDRIATSTRFMTRRNAINFAIFITTVYLIKSCSSYLFINSL